jgi:hypothetical protein
MIRLSIAFIACILAVGSIDGPTGHEGDNWSMCFSMMGLALAMLVWYVKRPSYND